ncbi:hypothetical protein Bbelb_352980 [Branchiostoma belcheri]|nr:hypothetical protein Bbelb_352980 [Branchiostoma belcheri]
MTAATCLWSFPFAAIRSTDDGTSGQPYICSEDRKPQLLREAPAHSSEFRPNHFVVLNEKTRLNASVSWEDENTVEVTTSSGDALAIYDNAIAVYHDAMAGYHDSTAGYHDATANMKERASETKSGDSADAPRNRGKQRGWGRSRDGVPRQMRVTRQGCYRGKQRTLEKGRGNARQGEGDIVADERQCWPASAAADMWWRKGGGRAVVETEPRGCTEDGGKSPDNLLRYTGWKEEDLDDYQTTKAIDLSTTQRKVPAQEQVSMQVPAESQTSRDVLRESAGRCAGLPSGECGTSSGRVRYVLRESAVRPAGECECTGVRLLLLRTSRDGFLASVEGLHATVFEDWTGSGCNIKGAGGFC